MRTWKTTLLASLALAALALPCPAQSFGVGASVGLVNDLSRDFEFQHSEVTGWIDYTMEKNVVLRGTYGDDAHAAGQLRDRRHPAGRPVTLPELKERIHYGTVGVSYLFWEGFYTSGIFAGIGGYRIAPMMPAEIANYQDDDETVFGWHVGVDGGFRVMKNLANGRAHVPQFYFSAHPHREFLNADGGLVVRF